jgi:hypothetical protein
MRSILRHSRPREEAPQREEATFCDACSSVCTPQCRYEARRDADRQVLYRNGLIRPF